MPRFHDDCDVDGCARPVKKIVADTVKGPRRIRERTEVVGLCREHKRDPETRHEASDTYDPDPQEELPF